MSQGVLCPNLTKKIQSKVSQMANHKLPCAVAIGGLKAHSHCAFFSDCDCIFKMGYMAVNGSVHTLHFSEM